MASNSYSYTDEKLYDGNTTDYKYDENIIGGGSGQNNKFPKQMKREQDLRDQLKELEQRKKDELARRWKKREQKLQLSELCITLYCGENGLNAWIADINDLDILVCASSSSTDSISIVFIPRIFLSQEPPAFLASPGRAFLIADTAVFANAPFS